LGLVMSSYRVALGEVLVELGREVRDLVVLDPDTPRSTGSIRFAREFPSRFVNVGISEQDLVSMAAGLAISGKLPVATAFAMFLMRAWEQVRNTVARAGLNVKLVGTHAGLSAFMDGSSHQVLEDVALMRVLPNFTVVSPADTESLRELLRQVVLDVKGPTYFRLGRDNAFSVYSRSDAKYLRVGEVSILEDGSDLVILTYGAMVGISLMVRDILKREGLSVGVTDVHTIKPLDTHGVLKVVKGSNYVVVLEEHRPVGGLASAITELLSDYGLFRRVLRLGVEGFGRSARDYLQLLNYLGLSPQLIAKKVVGWLGEVQTS